MYTGFNALQQQLLLKQVCVHSESIDVASHHAVSVIISIILPLTTSVEHLAWGGGGGGGG